MNEVSADSYTRMKYLDMETLRVFIVAGTTIGELPVLLEDHTWTGVNEKTVVGISVNGRKIDFDGGPTTVTPGDTLTVEFDGRFTIE